MVLKIDFSINIWIIWIVFQIFIFNEIFRSRYIFKHQPLGAGFMLGVLLLSVQLRRKLELLYALRLYIRNKSKKPTPNHNILAKYINRTSPIYKKQLLMFIVPSTVIVVLSPLMTWLERGFSTDVIAFVILMILSCSLHFFFPFVYLAKWNSDFANAVLEILMVESPPNISKIKKV